MSKKRNKNKKRNKSFINKVKDIFVPLSLEGHVEKKLCSTCGNEKAVRGNIFKIDTESKGFVLDAQGKLVVDPTKKMPLKCTACNTEHNRTIKLENINIVTKVEKEKVKNEVTKKVSTKKNSNDNVVVACKRCGEHDIQYVERLHAFQCTKCKKSYSKNKYAKMLLAANKLVKEPQKQITKVAEPVKETKKQAVETKKVTPVKETKKQAVEIKKVNKKEKFGYFFVMVQPELRRMFTDENSDVLDIVVMTKDQRPVNNLLGLIKDSINFEVKNMNSGLIFRLQKPKTNDFLKAINSIGIYSGKPDVFKNSDIVKGIETFVKNNSNISVKETKKQVTKVVEPVKETKKQVTKVVEPVKETKKQVTKNNNRDYVGFFKVLSKDIASKFANIKMRGKKVEEAIVLRDPKNYKALMLLSKDNKKITETKEDINFNFLVENFGIKKSHDGNELIYWIAAEDIGDLVKLGFKGIRPEIDVDAAVKDESVFIKAVSSTINYKKEHDDVAKDTKKVVKEVQTIVKAKEKENTKPSFTILSKKQSKNFTEILKDGKKAFISSRRNIALQINNVKNIEDIKKLNPYFSQSVKDSNVLWTIAKGSEQVIKALIDAGLTEVKETKVPKVKVPKVELSQLGLNKDTHPNKKLEPIAAQINKNVPMVIKKSEVLNNFEKTISNIVKGGSRRTYNPKTQNMIYKNQVRSKAPIAPSTLKRLTEKYTNKYLLTINYNDLKILKDDIFKMNFSIKHVLSGKYGDKFMKTNLYKNAKSALIRMVSRAKTISTMQDAAKTYRNRVILLDKISYAISTAGFSTKIYAGNNKIVTNNSLIKSIDVEQKGSNINLVINPTDDIDKVTAKKSSLEMVGRLIKKNIEFIIDKFKVNLSFNLGKTA